MMPTRRAVYQGAAASAVLFLTACARTPKPTPIAVTLNVDAGINPNERGEPSPVVVDVYELKGIKAFNNATYFDFADDAKTLGADMISRTEYELIPGKEQKYDREISSEATHIAVVAGFRSIQSAQWRDSVELDKGKKNEFIIYLTSLAVRIQKLRRRRFGVF
ncbi:type VI secretion system lipoprotein TssJ [Mesorhizobium sp. PL10]